MDSDRLRVRLERMASDPGKPQLHFESDAHARYERFDQLVAMIKRAGVEEVGFVGNEQFATWDHPWILEISRDSSRLGGAAAPRGTGSG